MVYKMAKKKSKQKPRGAFKKGKKKLGGRGPSAKSKSSKVKKLIRLASKKKRK